MGTTIFEVLEERGAQRLEELKELGPLPYLFVYENKLESLNGIENMKNLKDLYFQNNKISSLRPLKKLKKLETIYASGNSLSTFDGLTEKHGDNIRNFYGLPNENIRDREIIKFQNKAGIIVKKG